MDLKTRKQFINLHAETADLRNVAFNYIISNTENQVDWGLEIWDNLLEQLHHKNNHQRAIAAQILSNLAKSEPARLLADLDKLLKLTRDENLATARQTIQILWKVAASGKELKIKILEFLILRFSDCITENKYSLIRFDIIKTLRTLYDVELDENVRLLALQLIASETDLKFKKKYSRLWRDTFVKK